MSDNPLILCKYVPYSATSLRLLLMLLICCMKWNEVRCKQYSRKHYKKPRRLCFHFLSSAVKTKSILKTKRIPKAKSTLIWKLELQEYLRHHALIYRASDYGPPSSRSNFRCAHYENGILFTCQRLHRLWPMQRWPEEQNQSSSSRCSRHGTLS